MKKNLWAVLALCGLGVAAADESYRPAGQRLTSVELTCEYAANPLGVDVARPRFSWVLESSRRGQMQSAYQILVASSLERLKATAGDKWDSGRVDSDRSINVAYQGKPLASSERCWWKVRVWDKDGKPSDYSSPATFETGLLKQSDWQGKWIGIAASSPLARQFAVAKSGRGNVALAAKPTTSYVSGHEIAGRNQ